MAPARLSSPLSFPTDRTIPPPSLIWPEAVKGKFSARHALEEKAAVSLFYLSAADESNICRPTLAHTQQLQFSPSPLTSSCLRRLLLLLHRSQPLLMSIGSSEVKDERGGEKAQNNAAREKRASTRSQVRVSHCRRLRRAGQLAHQVYRPTARRARREGVHSQLRLSASAIGISS